MDLISIIIPTYNRAHLIGETLDSILKQTYTNWECIIVDDGSTDNTESLLQNYIKKDKRFSFYNRPKDKKKGGNAARNYGFKKSKGELIQWFDSDDIMHYQLLEKKSKQLVNRSYDYCLCRMGAFYIKNSKMNIRNTSNIESADIFLDYIKRKIAIGTPTVLWRRSIIDENNIFDENLNQSQDLEFNSRMLYNNSNACTINEVLVYYRVDGNSISNQLNDNIARFLDSFLEVRRRILLLNPKNTEINLAVIKDVLSIFRVCIVSKKYKQAEQIILFLRARNSTFLIRLKLERIFFFYKIFKFFGRGDTKFKTLLKL